MRFLKAICLFSLLCLISSCAKDIVDLNGSISGIVKDYNDAHLIANCQVALSPSGKSETTADDGSFSFSSLDPGEYTITFRKSGYEDNIATVSVVSGNASSLAILLKSKSPFALSAESYDFGDLEVEDSFTCFNNSDADCSYSISDVPSWATFNKLKGVVKAGSSDSFTVTVNKEGRSVGEYSQNVTITYSGKNQGSVHLLLKMKIVVLSIPKVSINALAENISNNGFNIGGAVSETGGSEIISYGHCWSNIENPTINDSKSDLGSRSDIGTYLTTVTGLVPNTTYYVRAYATNVKGTAYSEQMSVSTKSVQGAIWDGSKANSFAGGHGTSADPYIIKTGSQLVLIKDYSGRCFKIDNNIDLNNINWPSIQFSGTLDGNGFSIMNLKINSSDDGQGLFSKSSGSINNLTISGVDIQAGGSDYIGAFVGNMLGGGVIKNCKLLLGTSSKILGRNAVGGFVGYMGQEYNDYSYTISDCSISSSSNGNVISGDKGIGGIVGLINSGNKASTIEKCHVKANVQGTSSIGGLVGEDQSNAADYINNSSYTGAISGDSIIGGIIGGMNSYNLYLFIKGCKADVVINVENSYAGGIYGYSSGGIQVFSSYSKGSISGEGSTIKYVGGLGGFTDSNNYHDNFTLCYTTVTSSLSAYCSLTSGYIYAKNCASVIPGQNGKVEDCNTSCPDIVSYIRGCYSEYDSYWNYNSPWVWTGDVDGTKTSVKCPTLGWEK
jgi:hypothetical protein